MYVLFIILTWGMNMLIIRRTILALNFCMVASIYLLIPVVSSCWWMVFNYPLIRKKSVGLKVDATSLLHRLKWEVVIWHIMSNSEIKDTAIEKYWIRKYTCRLEKLHFVEFHYRLFIWVPCFRIPWSDLLKRYLMLINEFIQVILCF